MSSSFANKPTLAANRAPEETSWSLLIAVVLLATAPMIILSQVASYWRPDVVDDQMFAYFGWRILHGARVYLDVWDNKPPGIYWTNALGYLLGAGNYLGVIALCTIALVATHILFFVTCASVYFRGAAALTTVLLSFFITHSYYQGGCNRTETFVVVFELAAVATYTRGWANDRWWKWLLVGIFCGAAFLYKQVGLAAWGAMGLHLIVLSLTGQLPLAVAAKRCVLLLLGLCVTLAIASLALASQGEFNEAWFATFTFNRSYFEVGDSSLLDVWFNCYKLGKHMSPILVLPALMATAAVIHASVWWLWPAMRPPEIENPIRAFQPVLPNYMLLFGVWYLVALYGASVSPHHFRHYLTPTIPPLLLLCGHLISVLKTEASLLQRFAQRSAVVASFVVMGYFAADAAKRQVEEVATIWWERTHGKWQIRPTAWEAIAAEAVKYSTPEQKIHCWGYFPGVYLTAKRINVCRFITTEKIGHVGDYADIVRKDLHRAFQEDPPAVFVTSISDYAWFTDPQPGQKPRDWLGEWLAGWLDKNYARVAEVMTPVEAVYVYQRRDLQQAAGNPEIPVSTQPSQTQ